MAKSILEPLLRDHAKIRTLAGELKAHTERFDLPGMRTTANALVDIVRSHVLKEEAVFYLIGMKFLKANNKKIPELFKEHDQAISRLYNRGQLLYSARLTDIEDEARQLVFVILEGLQNHLAEEESVVFPALDKLIDDPHKELILHRYELMGDGEFDELDRLPLTGLTDAEPHTSGSVRSSGFDTL